MLSINHLSLHFVIDTDIASLRLLIILELNLDLVGSEVGRSLALLFFVTVRYHVLTVTQLILHVKRLLLLQMEVFDSLIALSIFAFV